MQNLFFVHMAADPKIPGRINIRRGQVKHAVGPAHWLLQFRGVNNHFSQVVPAADLVNFTFFEKLEDQDNWLAEVTAPKAAPAADQTPPASADATGAPSDAASPKPSVHTPTGSKVIYPKRKRR